MCVCVPCTPLPWRILSTWLEHIKLPFSFFVQNECRQGCLSDRDHRLGVFVCIRVFVCVCICVCLPLIVCVLTLAHVLPEWRCGRRMASLLASALWAGTASSRDWGTERNSRASLSNRWCRANILLCSLNLQSGSLIPNKWYRTLFCFCINPRM